MDPLLVALAGVAVVIGGVLVLRLPAFIALVAGAILVALLTPRHRIHDQELRSNARTVVRVVGSELVLADDGKSVTGLYLGFRPDVATNRLAPTARITILDDATSPTFELIDGRLLSGDLIIHELDLNAVRDVASRGPGERLAYGFGDTCRKIGLLIAMASIIGTCLLESGAAQRVVAATRAALGDRRAPLAFVISGFVIGIPVFFDTVFYLLMPLAKALRLRTGRDYLLYILAVVVGASMAHSLIPPTPGPLFVAASMNVSIVTMMLGGSIVGGIAVLAGYLYALWANRRWEIPLRDEVADASSAAAADLSVGAAHPALWLSLLPILLPVVLLASRAIMKVGLDAGRLNGEFWQWLRPVVEFCGDKNIALTLAAAVALATVVWIKSRDRVGIDIKQLVGPALASGGVIILITSAGGAFGHVLRQADVAGAIQSRMPSSDNGLALLVLAFFITAAIRVAQGSATVAMITAVGIVSPLATGMSLPYHPVYLALAIGCGSKPLPWMNDSGFWVVGKMSGMTELETLKTHSVTITIMGIVGFLVTLVGAIWLPLTVTVP
ncbi:MAG: SLC13 family permease [Gammaproteobacteria bacterium]|nr:SLC13 family permease [Gammaproteobacteria bacterium]